MPDERVHRVGYWLRERWLASLVVIGVVVVGISLLDLPFASGSNHGRAVVKVTGGQFFWSLVARTKCRPEPDSALTSAQSMSTMVSAFTTRTAIWWARCRRCRGTTTT